MNMFACRGGNCVGVEVRRVYAWRTRKVLCVSEFNAEAYRLWLEREELRDFEQVARRNRRLIENGDPECDAVIAALEAGWEQERQ